MSVEKLRGVPGWIRTSDPLLRRQLLYPLSYRDIFTSMLLFCLILTCINGFHKFIALIGLLMYLVNTPERVLGKKTLHRCQNLWPSPVPIHATE